MTFGQKRCFFLRQWIYRAGLATILMLGSAASLAAAELQPCTKVPLPLVNTDQIIEALICQLGGKVLKLEPVSNPPSHYQARILLDNGVVKTLLVDGKTGIPVN